VGSVVVVIGVVVVGVGPVVVVLAIVVVVRVESVVVVEVGDGAQLAGAAASRASALPGSFLRKLANSAQ
jgi:hypothetical protein